MSTRNSPDTGKAGPGNPPPGNRFRPGQSGNPGGRPKRERDLAKLVDKELDLVVTGTGDDGRQVKLTKREVVAKRLVAKAANGDLKAIDRIIDLASRRGADGNALIGIDPAILASFVRRYDAASGEPGETE
jgi:hypothetical protein